MATLHDRIVPLLKLGLKPAVIAKKLGCGDYYVRAVRAREFGRGKETRAAWRHKNREWAREYGRQYYRERIKSQRAET